MDNFRDSVTNQRGITNGGYFEIGQRETDPLLKKGPVKPASTGFWSCFSDLSVGASRLGRSIIACCSSVTKPIMSAYHFVVDKFYSDKVDYSKEQIDISENSDVQQNIPEKSSFTAGTKVRRELGKEVSSAAVEFLNKGDGSLDQFLIDINRTTQFKLVDSDGNFGTISYTPGKEESLNSRQKDIAVRALNETVGASAQGAYVTQAIASIANQTLGNTCNLLFANASRPSQKQEGSALPFSTTKIGGFFSPSGKRVSGEDAIINYTLEKKKSLTGEEHFILKYENEAMSMGYFEKNASDPSAPANVVPILGERTPTMKTSMSFKITPNKSFDASKPITEENSPVHIECLDFKNSYEFGAASVDV